MANSWYVQLMGREIGPLNDSQLRALAIEQRLKPHDQLRRGPAGTWVPADRVRGLFTAPADDKEGGNVATADVPQKPPPLPTAVPRVVHEQLKSRNMQKPCPDCAEKIPFDAKACPYCGLSFVDQNRSPQLILCPDCDKQISRTAKACPNCGHSFPRPNRMIAVALAWTVGGLGVHKFYLGRMTEGILSFLFCWTLIPAIVALIEGFLYVSMTDDEFAGKYHPSSSSASARDDRSSFLRAAQFLLIAAGWCFSVMFTSASLAMLLTRGLWLRGLFLAVAGVLLSPPTWKTVGGRMGFTSSLLSWNESSDYAPKFQWLCWAVSSLLVSAMLAASLQQASNDSGSGYAGPSLRENTPASINQEIHDRLRDLSLAKDYEGIERLIAMGLTFMLPENTKIRIIDLGVFTTEIKVESGPLAGQYLIVDTEQLNK